MVSWSGEEINQIPPATLYTYFYSPGLQCDPLSPPVFYTVCSTFEKPGFCKCVCIFIFKVSWWHVVRFIQVHISLKVCFQLHYVATVNTTLMKCRHINIITYILFRITSVLNYTSNTNLLVITVCIFLWMKDADYIFVFSSFLPYKSTLILLYTIFCVSKSMKKHTCVILSWFYTCFLMCDSRDGAVIKCCSPKQLEEF